MSRLGLQRVIVRMLYDPAFADRVYEEGAPEITAEERGWIVTADRRAWRADPHRRARSLAALLEEYPATAAQSGDPRALDAFFSSARFHATIRDGESLAISFGEWLAEEPSRREIATLETAVARARRARRRKPGDRLALPAGAALLQTREGLLERYETVLRALGSDPVPALLERKPPPDLPPWSNDLQWLLVVPGAIHPLPPPLARAVAPAGEPMTREQILTRLREEGAEEGDDVEILEELVRDGILVKA